MKPARCNRLSSSAGSGYTHHHWWCILLYFRQFLQYGQSSRVVVVLPLVPVMAIMGIRAGTSFWKKHIHHRFGHIAWQTFDGSICIRKPGAAFTSSIAPPFSLTGVRRSCSHNINTANIQSDDFCDPFTHKNIGRMHFIGYIGRWYHR